jgi:hypothetical protein
MRYAIAMFTAAAAMFIVMAAETVLKQQQLIDAARPVPGTVVSSRVLEETTTDPKNRRTTTFRPDVLYRYGGGNSIHKSNQVFPMFSNTSRERAAQIVADHPPGKAVTVWLDPARGGKSFLLREWDFAPYLTILMAMVFLSVGLGFWAAAPWRRQKVWPPKALPAGGFEVPVGVSVATRRRPWRVVPLVWFVLGGVVAWHYLTYAQGDYELAALVALPLYFAIGLIPLGIYVRHVRRARAFKDARVIANAEAFRLGKTFDVRVEQAFGKAARVESARLGLVCDKLDRAPAGRGKLAVRRSTLFETWTDLAAGADVARDKPLQARGKLTPPADQPATTAEEQSGWPRHAWRIVVVVKLANRPEYRADYPIVVGA